MPTVTDASLPAADAPAPIMFPFPWRREGNLLCVSPHGSTMPFELQWDRRPVCQGHWDAELRVRGRPVAADSTWEETCRFQDEDADFFEWELSFGDDWKLQRQVLVARKDGFVLLADALLGEHSDEVEYTSRWPLAPGARCEPVPDFREGILSRSRARIGTVLPLALPEWRSERVPGELTSAAGSWEWVYKGPAQRIYLPLFFDLQPHRQRRPRTWRRLTVAEELVIQPPDVAVGFRVQIGEEQWLIYRSLGPRGNRTLLGHNLATEFLVGRFRPTGKVEKIVEVIGAEEETTVPSAAPRTLPVSLPLHRGPTFDPAAESPPSPHPGKTRRENTA